MPNRNYVLIFSQLKSSSEVAVCLVQDPVLVEFFPKSLVLELWVVSVRIGVEVLPQEWQLNTGIWVLPNLRLGSSSDSFLNRDTNVL